MKQFEQIFILGAPRSGTTFLASLLADTRFGAPVESHFITKYHRRLSSYGDLDEFENFQRLLTDILAERPIMQWKLDLDVRHLFDTLQADRSYRNIINSLFDLRGADGKPGCWGDKTPHYLGDFDILHDLFPNARYLYITRDGRDVALSLLGRSWGPNNIYGCAEYWRDLNTLSETMKSLIASGHIHTLKYEELLQTPAAHLQAIYAFIEEPVNATRIAELAATANPDNCYKWKKRLSTRQQVLFQNLAGDVLEQLGYDSVPASGKVSPVTRAAYSAHSLFTRCVFLFKINVIDGFRIRFLKAEPFND